MHVFELSHILGVYTGTELCATDEYCLCPTHYYQYTGFIILQEIKELLAYVPLNSIWI